MPCDLDGGGTQIDAVHHLAALDVGNVQLLLLAVFGAGADVAPVEAEVDGLDGARGEIQGAHTDPLVRVPQADEGVAAARGDVFPRGRVGDGIAARRVGVQAQGGGHVRVAQDLDEALAVCGVEVVAGPVEDALVGLQRLAVLRLHPHLVAVDGHEAVVLAAGDDGGAVRTPGEGEGALVALVLGAARRGRLADAHLADDGLCAYVPEAHHAIGAARGELVLVDGMEGDALECNLGRGGLAGSRLGDGCQRRAQLRRVLDIGALRVPDAQRTVGHARRNEAARRIPRESPYVVRRRHPRPHVVRVRRRLELAKHGREALFRERPPALCGRHLFGKGGGGGENKGLSDLEKDDVGEAGAPVRGSLSWDLSAKLHHSLALSNLPHI